VRGLGLRHSATIMASLMMSGLMPMGSGPEPPPEPRRIPPPAPYFPTSLRLLPLTPEQIKAQEKRARKAAKLKGTP
jgi:hypothetical protein